MDRLIPIGIQTLEDAFTDATVGVFRPQRLRLLRHPTICSWSGFPAATTQFVEQSSAVCRRSPGLQGGETRGESIDPGTADAAAAAGAVCSSATSAAEAAAATSISASTTARGPSIAGREAKGRVAGSIPGEIAAATSTTSTAAIDSRFR